jgi:hypothetical protein
MRGSPNVPVPPMARARALGALLPPGSHAVAYATAQAESLLTGFVLEGLEAGERSLVLAGAASPRSLSARLRAQGVAPPKGQPSALRVLPEGAVQPNLEVWIRDQSIAALREGYDGVRFARLCSAARAKECLREEAALPRRFALPVTMLCVYTEANLGRIPAQDAWAAAKAHGRILLL